MLTGSFFGTQVDVSGVKGVLEYFLVEPFLPHQASDEYYLAIRSGREGDEILFHHEGGVDVGDVDSKALVSTRQSRRVCSMHGSSRSTTESARCGGRERER